MPSRPHGPSIDRDCTTPTQGVGLPSFQSTSCPNLHRRLTAYDSDTRMLARFRHPNCRSPGNWERSLRAGLSCSAPSLVPSLGLSGFHPYRGRLWPPPPGQEHRTPPGAPSRTNAPNEQTATGRPPDQPATGFTRAAPEASRTFRIEWRTLLHQQGPDHQQLKHQSKHRGDPLGPCSRTTTEPGHAEAQP